MSKPKDAAPSAPQEILPPLPAKAGAGKAGKAKKPEKSDEDAELEGFMSEIEADLREDELKKIWQRYGKAIIAAMAIMVLAVLGVQQWRQYAAEQRLELAARYEQAMKDASAGKTDEAAAIFADVAKSKGEGLATLAQLERTAIMLQKNDVPGAVAIYREVAADNGVDRTFRDLAIVLEVLHTLDTGEPKVLEAKLSPLSGPGNAFHNTALELSALLAAKQGDNARAGILTQQLVDDPTTPPAMRQRAQDLAAYYKGLTAAPPVAAAAPPAAPAEAKKP